MFQDMTLTQTSQSVTMVRHLNLNYQFTEFMLERKEQNA